MNNNPFYEATPLRVSLWDQVNEILVLTFGWYEMVGGFIDDGW